MEAIIKEKFTSDLKFLLSIVFNWIMSFSIILQINQSLKSISILVSTYLRLVQMSHLAITNLQFQTYFIQFTY